MEQRDQLFRKISYPVMVLFALESIIAGIYFISMNMPYEYILSFGGLLFLPLPFWLCKLLRMKPVYQLNVMVYLFVFIAYTLGLIFHWYTFVPDYDKFAHTLSGLFVTILALGLFYLLKPLKRIESCDFRLASVFSLAVSIAVAGIWEFSEYAISMIFGTDPQNVLATGVHDTMQDMLVCTLGSLIMLFPIWLYYRKGKRDFFMGTFETFFNHFTNREKGHMKKEKKEILIPR